MKQIRTLIQIILSLLIIILLFYIFHLFHLKKIFIYIFYLLFPLMIALFIQLLLEPIIDYFVSERIDRKIVVIFLYCFIVVITLILLYKLLPSCINYIITIYHQYTHHELTIPPLINQLIDLLNEYQLVNPIIKTTKNISAKMISFISSLILGLGISFYLSLDQIHLVQKIITYIPFNKQKEYMKTLKRIKLMTITFIKSLTIDFILFFTISLITFFFINRQYCIYIALFLALTNLIPYIGPFIGSLIIFLYEYMIDATLGYISLLVLVILQYIESSYIQPMLFSKKMHIHPIILLLSLTLFKDLFGIVGMILSPLLLTYIRFIVMLIKEVVSEYKGCKNEIKMQ